MPPLPAPTTALPRPGKEARKIRAMFDEIAGRYDLLNRLLSAQTDVAWRRLAVRTALHPDDRAILDLACGTGDLTLELRRAAPDARIVGADFSRQMLAQAQVKDSQSSVSWIHADGLSLPFPDNSFDLVTIAFGIRNMENLDQALAEIRRVLRPGGRLCILEFSRPDNPLVRLAYYPYFLHILPRIGALLSRRSAYLYLPLSVLHFPGRKELARRMIRRGYTRVRHCALTFGIAAIHLGEKRRHD